MSFPSTPTYILTHHVRAPCVGRGVILSFILSTYYQALPEAATVLSANLLSEKTALNSEQ